MTYWTWITGQGEFHIEEIGPNRIDLLFGNSVIGSYPTPQEAADRCGEGHHARISEAFDGASLGVSCSLTDWIQARAIDSSFRDDPVDVPAETQQLASQSNCSQGTLHLPRNR